MKKQFRKLALAVIFAMAVSIIAPAAQVVEAATTKTFTYAEQQTGDTVTTLIMDKGEKVDLKFNGVSNWKTYKYKWVSSNPKVAVVDSAGVITALGQGVATIKLTISGGDGTKYTSTGVTVYVDSLDQEITIGTNTQEEIKSYTIEMGKKATLKANGIKDNVGDRYEFSWTSTDTTVATINESGVITTKAPGLSVIQLTVKKVFSGEEFEATPIALLVTGDGTYIPPTATPTPTQKPGATATPTPTPTQKPGATATPTPTPVPSDKYVDYTVTLKSDKEILLTFDNTVAYTTTDIQLYQLITAGNTVIPVKWEVANVTLDKTGRQVSVVPAMAFISGQRYMIKVGSADTEGSTFNVVIGEPNRVEITYECLGTKGVAYAYDATAAVDVPVELSYRLYYGNIDVTETYSGRGYMYYEFVSSKYYENVSLGDNTLSFYEPNVTVVLTGTFNYYDESGTPKTVKGNVSVRSTKLPSYGIVGVVKTTIIENAGTNFEKIDWNKPVNQIVANTQNAKIVAILADTYGNFYVTDQRGVDEENNIFYAGDFNQLFSKFGYGVKFSAADPNQIIISEDGSMYPFKALSSAVAIVTLTNNGLNGGNNYNKNIGVAQFRVLEEGKLATLAVESSVVTLATSALSGFERRFCETDVEILLKDQYGSSWKGTSNLTVTSTVPEINTALDGTYGAPAVMNGTTLHINAINIKRITNRTSIPFIITETNTNKKITVTVTLQNPITSNGSIIVSGWNLGLQNTTINLGEPKQGELTQYATIEAYKTSTNGIKVGLYNDLHILETTNYAFTTTNCKAGEIYILVKDPTGKVVNVAANNAALGVYVDDVNHCVKVNVSAPALNGSMVQEAMQEGQYTITATRIISVGTVVQKVSQTATFMVKDETRDVTFRSVKNVSTALTVSGENDLSGIREVVLNTLTFNLDEAEWTTLTSNMITGVEYIMNGNTVVIRKVEFAVPVDSNNPNSVTYKQSCDVNKAIRTGVAE